MKKIISEEDYTRSTQGSVISLSSVRNRTGEPPYTDHGLTFDAVCASCAHLHDVLYILDGEAPPQELIEAAERYGIRLSSTPKNSKRHKRIVLQEKKDEMTVLAGEFTTGEYGGNGRYNLRTYGKW